VLRVRWHPLWVPALRWQDGRAQGIDAAAQARGHHLRQLDQRTQRAFFDAAHRARRRDLQGNSHGKCLFVVQQQRRQRLSGAKRVTAGHAAAGMDGVAELTQSVDVASQGARVDLELLGQIGAGPMAARLQQRQHPQQPRRG
jgi:hypothetical protein